MCKQHIQASHQSDFKVQGLLIVIFKILIFSNIMFLIKNVQLP